MFRLPVPFTAAALAVAPSLLLGSGPRAQTLPSYMPTTAEVILDTDFTQITPIGGPPINVTGGVFVFHDVTIPAGVTVRGIGSNPMIWIVTGDFIVNGRLFVNGEDGQRVDTLQAAQFPAAGGAGVCGGGNGGRGSPETTRQTNRGEFGFGPGQVPNLGGGGGRLGCLQGCGRGSGGGGGAFATQGDPYFMVTSSGTSFVQQLGAGGYGCLGQSGALTRTLPGGMPGIGPFSDSRDDNNFFGVALNVQQRTFIHGELPGPMGGSGGGGGGDRSVNCGFGAGNWRNDNKGGGGGGGGGALVILAGNKISVGPNGRIEANGGHGGGGEQAGGNNQGGGGGGGSGGMIVLYSLGTIELAKQGETYARQDYYFSLSADGGLGSQGQFGGVPIGGKYPPPLFTGHWDNNPTGGFGGLGVVQLHTRPGTDADLTGTVLDDNIHILDGTTRLTGIEKQRFLAWRGFPNQQGVWVNDFNNPTYNNPSSTPGYPVWATSANDEGDIRPAPILLPIL